MALATPRRVTIVIKVEEQTAPYIWDEVATTELSASAEMFDAVTAATALTTAIADLLGRPAPENRAARTAVKASAPDDLSDVAAAADEFADIPF